MKSSRERRGQFVIIAVMLTAIMIVSIGTLMHGAITYYKHEPWEEYSTLIGDIEVNSRRVVELSLAQATPYRGNVSILIGNLANWQNDLADIYPSSGISLTSSGHQITQSSNATASTAWTTASFMLNIRSIGLEGYKFSVSTFLSIDARNDSSVEGYNIRAVVMNDRGALTGLDKSNFIINGFSEPNAVTPFYDAELDTLVYRIQFQGTAAEVQVTDHRGISVKDSTL